MPKSSRHKSSKHSSRDAREYSDSEKDSGVGLRVSKESGEKRKLDSKESKDVLASGNGDYVENNNSSSKRRKDRGDDGANDRWNGGGGDDDRTIEGSTRKSKASSESKSKRRDENEEQRSKSDGKHRESSRKESREAEREREKERERKGKEGKIERFVESEDHSRASTKQSVVNEKTELNAQDLLPSPESEKQLDRRVRRRRDGSGDGDKHEVDIGDNNGRHKDDVANDVRLKDEKHKDVRYRDKYREDGDRDSKHRDDKQRDEHPKRDHASSRSNDKHLKDEKDADSRQKQTKVQDSDREREFDHDHDRDFDSGRDRDRYRERDRDRDYDHDRNRDRIRDGGRDRDRDRNKEIERERDLRERDRDRERERERERERNRDRDLDHDRDRDLDHDGSLLDDRKYKGSRGKKRSPDERDDYSDNKSRGIKGYYPDLENKSLSNSRVESDADRGRSQSRQAYVDSTISNRRRTSRSPSSHGGADDYRHSKQEDKYLDSVTEQRSKAISSRQVSGFSGVTERGSKYRSSERSNKMDDGHLGELPVDRSMSSKASPMGLVERSPSSTSLDLRYINRTGIRRGLDVEETGWRGSVGPRELSTTEDRLSRDLPLEKPMVDDSSQMDLLYYNRISQGSSSSSLPPPPAFRAGVGSPSFMGSLEEDGRGNISARYRRSGDSNLGRGQGSAWRGPPNWSSPVPNGFIPFQHGPPHGGFQTMMPQFPSPSLFAVRPSMELNHSGIPYHIPDADRFSSHLRPLGWQNMMDGSGPSHLHGWDGNNGGFRDEPHMYGGSDWDQNRHMMNGRGWETSSDMWKGENGDTNMDLPSMSQKEDIPVQAHSDDGLAVKVSQQADSYENNNHGVLAKSDEPRSISSPAKDTSELPSKTAHEKTSDPSKRSSDDDVAHRCRVYLSKLDISADLAGEGLYSQCMSLLGTHQTATPETETTVIVNLKDGGRPIPKCSKTLLSPPFFPAANDSVFQRAMNYYKKQSIQIGFLNGGKLDIISKSNEEIVEQGSLCNVDKVEGSVLINDIEMSDSPMSTPDQVKPEAVSGDVHEVAEDRDSAPCPVVQDDTHTPPPNVEMPNQDFTPKSPEEPFLVFNEDTSMNGLISEQVITEGADGNHSPTLDNATHADAILPADDNKMDEEISNDSFYPPEEKQGLGDAINDPIYLSDGSPKISEAMMPGSNESESVILNRIHHSPESTH